MEPEHKMDEGRQAQEYRFIILRYALNLTLTLASQPSLYLRRVDSGPFHRL